MTESWPIPETTKEALELWDSGKFVTTLEMGNVGPGHEQCIHIAVFELIRYFISEPLSSDTDIAYSKLNALLHKINDEKKLKLEGDQERVIKGLAYHYLTYGYASTIKTYGNKRTIMVSSKFPTGG